jgi:hypothetical protein
MTEEIQTPQTPAISLNDFIVVVSIIDACSQRGAFKGEELAAVGQLRDKFVEFIKTNTPQEKTDEVTE